MGAKFITEYDSKVAKIAVKVNKKATFSLMQANNECHTLKVLNEKYKPDPVAKGVPKLYDYIEHGSIYKLDQHNAKKNIELVSIIYETFVEMDFLNFQFANLNDIHVEANTRHWLNEMVRTCWCCQ